MTRDEVLKKLCAVKFEFIDPKSDWEDIGFTEREIWVNSQGYGYLSCDEPNGTWKGFGLCEDKWSLIKRKLLSGDLNIDDIKDTPLFEPFKAFCCFDTDEDDDKLACQELHNLLDLDYLPNDHQKLYCIQDWDGLLFYNNEEEYLRAYERDYCDYSWNELSDDALEEWIKRLF